MKRSTILAGVLAGAALAGASPALASAHTIYGTPGCYGVTFGALSFPAGSTSSATFDTYVDGRFVDNLYLTFVAELPAYAITYPAPLNGEHVVTVFGSYTASDGNGARRLISTTPLACSTGPTPAPTPTPGEETPAPGPAITPAPIPGPAGGVDDGQGVKLPGPDKPPTIKLPGPDKPKPHKRPRKPRRFTSCTIRGNVIAWPTKPAGVVAHRAADGRWYPVTRANGPCGPVQGAG